MNKILMLCLVGTGAIMRTDADSANVGLGNLLVAGGIFGLVKDVTAESRNV